MRFPSIWIKKKLKECTMTEEEKFDELYGKYGVPKEVSEALKDDRPELGRRDKFITVIVPMIIAPAVIWLLTGEVIGSCLLGLLIGVAIGYIGIDKRRNDLAQKRNDSMGDR